MGAQLKLVRDDIQDVENEGCEKHEVPEANAGLAMQDAIEDMINEGCTHGEVIDQVWYASYLVIHNEGGYKHGVIRINGDNMEQAVGRMYIEVREDFPAEDGWGPPDIFMDPTPAYVVPWSEHLIIPTMEITDA